MTPTKKALLERYLELSGAKKNYTLISDRSLDLFKKNLTPLLQAHGLEQEVEKFVEEFKKFSAARVEESMEKIGLVIAKYYDEETLTDLCTFLSTPAGRKMTELTPVMVPEIMEVGSSIGEELSKEMRRLRTDVRQRN